MKLNSLIEKIGFGAKRSKSVDDVTTDKFEDFGVTVGQLYQKFLNKQIRENNMKDIKLLVFSPFEDFKITGIETRKNAPCVLYNVAKRKDLAEAQKKLKKTKWYDNLLTEDFKRLNINKKIL